MSYNDKEKNNKILTLSAKDSGFTYTLFIALMCIITFIVQEILPGKENDIDFWTSFVYSLISPLTIVGIIIFTKIYYKRKFFSLMPLKKPRVEYIVLSLILVFAMICGLGGVNNYVVRFFEYIGLNASSDNIIIGDTWQFVAFFISICVLPAILEEILFRGIILEGLQKCGTIFAVLISGLIFALFHCNVAQFAYQFIYGVMLALIVVVSKNVIYSMLAHFLNNVVVFCFSYFLPDVDLQVLYLLIVGIVLFLVCAGVLVWRLIIMIRNTEKVNLRKQKLDFLLFSSAGILLTVLTIVLGLVVE